MAGIPFLAVGFLMKVVAVVWFICAVVLVLVVLIQKGRGGGLSSAFGGMAGGVLGTKTGDFLTWVTVGLVCVFLSLSLVIAKYYKPTVTILSGLTMVCSILLLYKANNASGNKLFGSPSIVPTVFTDVIYLRRLLLICSVTVVQKS